jgi:hypothetical protein
MIVYKKFLIALIIIIFSYIFWRLLAKRKEILQTTEPFTFDIFSDAATGELNSLKDSTLKNNIDNLPKAYYDLPLMEFCIKGSYNSAYTGNYMNVDMLKYQLSRGCRFFDFEVYYIQNKDSDIYSPQVGYSVDSKKITMDSTNTLLLDNVLSALVSSGFSSQNSPNFDDPLFINLRIKSNNIDVYKAVAKSIDYSIKDKLYRNPANVEYSYKDGNSYKYKYVPNTSLPVGKVYRYTPIRELMRKVVLSVDKTIEYSYKDYTKCESNSKACYDLTNYINIESGSENMNLNRYINISNQPNTQLIIRDNNLNTNVKSLNLILPDVLPENASNPKINDFVLNYGFQIVPFKFYKPDDSFNNALYKYELFFNDNKGGIVPLSIATMYFKKLQEQNS